MAATKNKRIAGTAAARGRATAKKAGTVAKGASSAGAKDASSTRSARGSKGSKGSKGGAGTASIASPTSRRSTPRSQKKAEAKPVTGAETKARSAGAKPIKETPTAKTAKTAKTTKKKVKAKRAKETALPASKKSVAKGGTEVGAAAKSRLSPTRAVSLPVGQRGPITPEEREAFRALLVEKREQVVSQYELDLRTGLQAPQDGMDDLVDRANVAYNRDLTFLISDGERELLSQIKSALVRIEDGSFGLCAPCHGPIGRQRLQAVPWARYCVDCQERAEQGLLAHEA